MIEDPDVHKRHRFPEPSRDEFICLARLGNP
jgi:hypothetical protein